MNPASPISAGALTDRPTLAFIDATRPGSGRILWGMTVVERQVRELARLGVGRVAVWTSAAVAPTVRRLRDDLHDLYTVEVCFPLASGPEELGRFLAEVDEPVLLLQGDVVYDERVLAELMQAGPGIAVIGADGAGAAHLEPAQARSLGVGLGAGRPLAELVDEAGCHRRRPEELEQYIPSLRLVMVPLLEQVPGTGSLGRLERLMYHRTFKGVIDAVARYGYYHLVRWITRGLSRTSLTPNLFTVLSVVAVWATVPCFAAGRFGLGVAVAWVGVLLDSVDGKLARLRLHLSESMGAFEHLAAMPGLGLWYAATGWHLSGSQLLTTQPMALVTWGFLAAFLADKAVTGGFRSLTGRELFDYRPLDAAFHLVAARRNISLVLLTLGALADRVAWAFIAAAAWTAVTLLFHAVRFSWLVRRRGAVAGS